jgi:hypothetical protein
MKKPPINLAIDTLTTKEKEILLTHSLNASMFHKNLQQANTSNLIAISALLLTSFHLAYAFFPIWAAITFGIIELILIILLYLDHNNKKKKLEKTINKSTEKYNQLFENMFNKK